MQRHLPNLLWAIGLVFLLGNSAMAAHPVHERAEINVISALQDNNGSKPLVIDHVVAAEVPQIISFQEFFALQPGIPVSNNAEIPFAGISPLYNASYLIQDKRQFIYLYLFPFHFFW